jgi:hypothetical protein
MGIDLVEEGEEDLMRREMRIALWRELLVVLLGLIDHRYNDRGRMKILDFESSLKSSRNQKISCYE